MPGNQYWERPKDRLVHGPLQAPHTAVINVSILLELCDLAIEGPAFPVNRLRSPNAPPQGSESPGLKVRYWSLADIPSCTAHVRF